MTMWSYCSQIQRLEARSGQAISVVNASSVSVAGTLASSMTGRLAGATQGRSYSGLAWASGSIGKSATTAP